MDTIDDEATAPLLDGRYRLDGCVGRGGTSMVYRAHDTLLRRTVAIKLLRADDEMPLESERVHSETALLASLSHPSLVALYDASLDLPHPRYLVMEYVDGPTLATHLTHGPLSRGEAAAIGRDLADALRVVHARGIVHRDVKPSNVLLARADDDAGWNAKLTDFGIAFHPDEARRTSPGIAIGTAAYMAPEQVRADPITPAADIYSLGLLLLESLTGEPAFPRTRDVQTALARLVREPSIPDELGIEWVRLLRRMTSSEPEQRPTAAEVVAEVSALSADARDDTTGATKALPAVSIATPVAPRIASATTPDVRPRRPMRRRTMGVFAGAAAAATVLAGAWMAWPAGPSPAPSETPALVAETPAATDVEQPAQAPVAVQTTIAEPAAETPVRTARTAAETASDKSSAPSAKNENAGPGRNSGSGPETNSGKGSDKNGNSHGKGKNGK